MENQTTTKKSLRKGLYGTRRRILYQQRVKHKTGINSDSVCLYFHEPSLFSEEKLLNDVKWYKNKLKEANIKQRIKKVYIVTKDAEEILIYDI